MPITPTRRTLLKVLGSSLLATPAKAALLGRGAGALLGNWILANNFWVDSGSWLDSAVWLD
jgi:hypothetical protein